MRDLTKLPKAHLHLHFTGAMRPSTMFELAREQRLRLPAHLLESEPLRVPANQRGWFRFQRSYDAARHLVRTEDVMRRLVREAAEDDVAEGSRRLEIQVDPTSYAPYVGGLTPALEIVLDESAQVWVELGLEVGVVVSSSRIRHPLDARTLARLAARYAGDGPGRVIAFGLSNDERAGVTAEFGAAFRIAREAGLAGVPHGGELLGPRHALEVVDHLGPTRLGHGVRLAESARALDRVVEAGIALEVCPASNVSLGVYENLGDVPVRRLLRAGATVALGADDPLLFRSRLADQYELLRTEQGFTDVELAELARSSICASLAAESSKRLWLSEVDEWLNNPLQG